MLIVLQCLSSYICRSLLYFLVLTFVEAGEFEDGVYNARQVCGLGKGENLRFFLERSVIIPKYLVTLCVSLCK